MSQRIFRLITLAGLLVAAGGTAHAAMQFPLDWYTTGVYDENVNFVNPVDREMEPGSLAAFTTAVAAAYEGNYGGVCGWDYSHNYSASNPNLYGLSTGTSGRANNHIEPLWVNDTGGQSEAIFYGKDSSKPAAANWAPLDRNTGKFVRWEAWDIMDIWAQTAFPSVGWPISGNCWAPESTQNVSDPAWSPTIAVGRGGTIGATTSLNWSDQSPQNNTKAGMLFHRDIDPAHPNFLETWTAADQKIKEVGFTGLSCSDHSGDWDTWVVYDDGTESAHQATTIAASATNADDVFFHFAAPAGKYIAEVWWQSSAVRPQIDDFGFIVENGPPAPVWHPGDANKDGAVDLQDFGLLKENFGIEIGGGALWEQGDFNKDGGIDLQDFGILKDHFGHTTGTVPVTAVPEPATMSLLALAGVGLLRRRAR